MSICVYLWFQFAYYANGKRIAMRRNEALSYLFSDHLGGTSVVLDATTGATNTITFYPFGSTRTGSVPTDYRFTGQKADDSTGLYFYGARYYDAYYKPTRGYDYFKEQMNEDWEWYMMWGSRE